MPKIIKNIQLLKKKSTSLSLSSPLINSALLDSLSLTNNDIPKPKKNDSNIPKPNENTIRKENNISKDNNISKENTNNNDSNDNSVLPLLVVPSSMEIESKMRNAFGCNEWKVDDTIDNTNTNTNTNTMDNNNNTTLAKLGLPHCALSVHILDKNNNDDTANNKYNSTPKRNVSGTGGGGGSCTKARLIYRNAKEARDIVTFLKLHTITPRHIFSSSKKCSAYFWSLLLFWRSGEFSNLSLQLLVIDGAFRPLVLLLEA